MDEPSPIQKLDEVVINRIAAGEVIQRPANALKEMIENSFDAKSTNIQITVKNGGLKLLQIQDNGTGIRREDFEIVCERFTTSKLREFEDLNSIATYGFRGEALASISHVAHLTIVSKTARDKCAYKASYEDGKLKDAVVPIAGNKGTQITVEDLFYNMKVRKNALRSPAEEYQKISDVVGKYSIHNSSTGFSLKKHGGNNDIRTPPNSTSVDNIRTIYGNNIARELIEFNMENTLYKFKAYGQMTNVNYSSKKLQFVLFINHRLVDCQSLKKCIDQIYSTYLPKNMHPFIYMSLEIDPKNIDVNVHPTKHEVHFLNEEPIVELITSAVETKLLGSNNSRIFYTQAKLPKLCETSLSDANKTMHAKDLVRTDSSEQKLEKFFGPAVKKSEDMDSVWEPAVEISVEREKISEAVIQKPVKLDAILSEEALQKENAKMLEGAEAFEDKLLDTTMSEASPKKKVAKDGVVCGERTIGAKKLQSIVTNFGTQKKIIPVRLKSVIDLQSAIENNCEDALREIFADHVFVGCINPRQSLVQHGTRLYLCDTEKIMQELFYQFLVFNFQNFDIYKFENPLPVMELVRMALDLPEAGWTPEDGEKDELTERVCEILTEKGKMLDEYFSMEIDEKGMLKSLPILVEKHQPDMAGLPMYLLRLATEVDWDEEKHCFETFSRETAVFYSCPVETPTWKHVTEHVLYPAIKDYFCPDASFKTNGALLQIADLPNLYKVFERC